MFLLQLRSLVLISCSLIAKAYDSKCEVMYLLVAHDRDSCLSIYWLSNVAFVIYPWRGLLIKSLLWLSFCFSVKVFLGYFGNLFSFTMLCLFSNLLVTQMILSSSCATTSLRYSLHSLFSSKCWLIDVILDSYVSTFFNPLPLFL